MRRFIRSTAWLTAILLTTLQGSSALAQVGGSVTLVSEYSFRGVSLNSGRPATQLAVEFDSRDHWYGGIFASPVSLSDDRRSTQVLTYAGFADRVTGDVSWELGVLRSSFVGAAGESYAEAYAGLSFGRLAGRLYLSPDYYGLGVRTAYLELEGAYPLSQSLQITGHAGYLGTSGADASGTAPLRDRWDIRTGIAARLDDWSVKLMIVATQKRRKTTGYAYGDDHGSTASSAAPADSPTFVVSVGRSF